MSIEQTIIPALIAATNTTVRSLHAEQLDSLEPIVVPLVTLSRVGAEWGDWDTFCSGNTNLADVLIQVDCYAINLEDTRRLADICRQAMATIAGSGPESEFDVWEPVMRVYRVTMLFSVTDYNPTTV